MAATPSWPPPPALLGYRRCEAVFRSAREEAAPSACFVADRRALSRHCGSARHAAGMGTDRELRSYSPRWMRSTAKLAENVRRRDEFPRRRCWGWTAADTGPKAGLVKLSLPDMRQKRVVLQAYAAVMSLVFMGRPAAPRRTEVTAVCAPIRGRRGTGRQGVDPELRLHAGRLLLPGEGGRELGGLLRRRMAAHNAKIEKEGRLRSASSSSERRHKVAAPRREKGRSLLSVEDSVAFPFLQGRRPVALPSTVKVVAFPLIN